MWVGQIMERTENPFIGAVQRIGVIFILVTAFAAPMMSTPHTFDLLNCNEEISGFHNVCWGSVLYLITFLITRKYGKARASLMWLPSMILIPVFGVLTLTHTLKIFAWQFIWGVPEGSAMVQYTLVVILLLVVDNARYLIRLLWETDRDFSRLLSENV